MRIRFSGNQVKIQTPAKVNLFLELHDRREDGFHQLETIISSVSLFDTVRLQPRRDHKLKIHVSPFVSHSSRIREPSIPVNRDNLIYQAFKLVREHVSKTQPERKFCGIDAWIEKRIPSQAGLGGASSNAAGALLGANHIWRCGLDLNTLQKLGSRLGSDVPFFLTGGSAACVGRGEQVQSVDCVARIPMVIAKPPVGLSTSDVYRGCVVPSAPRSITPFLEQMSTKRIGLIGQHLFNRLESVASGMTEWIERLKSSFSRINCLGHQMTGSGSSYFGLFSNQLVAQRAANCLSNRHPDAKIFACATLSRFDARPFLPGD